eukprot:95821_1
MHQTLLLWIYLFIQLFCNMPTRIQICLSMYLFTQTIVSSTITGDKYVLKNAVVRDTEFFSFYKNSITDTLGTTNEEDLDGWYMKYNSKYIRLDYFYCANSVWWCYNLKPDNIYPNQPWDDKKTITLCRTTPEPSRAPTKPTTDPTTLFPTNPTLIPTQMPTKTPTTPPTTPTSNPTAPTSNPTAAPTESPTTTLEGFTGFWTDLSAHQVAGLYIAFCFFCGSMFLLLKSLNCHVCWRRQISGFAPFTVPYNIEDIHLSNDEIIIKHWNNYSLKQDNRNETMVKAHGVQWKSCRFTAEIVDNECMIIKLKHSSGKYLSLTSYSLNLSDYGRLLPQSHNNNNNSQYMHSRSLTHSDETQIYCHQISTGVYRFESEKDPGYYMAVLPPTERNYFIGTPRMIHINDPNYSKYTLFYLFKKSENKPNQ